VPELNVQNGVLKSLSFLFEYIGEMGKDYIYAVTPLLEDALMDRDLVHRQTAASVIQHMAMGVAGAQRILQCCILASFEPCAAAFCCCGSAHGPQHAPITLRCMAMNVFCRLQQAGLRIAPPRASTSHSEICEPESIVTAVVQGWAARTR